MKTHHIEKLLTSLTGIPDRIQRVFSVTNSIPDTTWQTQINICRNLTGIRSKRIRIRHILIRIGLMLIRIRQILISIGQILVRICLVLIGIEQILIRIHQNPINLKQIRINIRQVPGKSHQIGIDPYYKFLIIKIYEL